MSSEYYFVFEMRSFLNHKLSAMPLELLTLNDLQEFKNDLLQEIKKLLLLIRIFTIHYQSCHATI